ncbi:MAG TPA: VOC family protein [Candidatus Acidoferrales bacterium]|jgi:predicted enzyme related to lactoylglutathione lyase|nr:VOC family protein [Candidatus Acidoferrales bacterium]
MKTGLVIPCVAVLSFALGMTLESARGKVAAPAAHVTGIGGIFFKSRDPQKLAAWYREHLGIELTPETNAAGAPPNHGFEWSEKSDATKLGMTVWALFPQSTKYFGAGPQPFMIDYRVDNLDGLLAQLRAAGVAVPSKISEAPNGRFAWATDSEGNRFELWEPKP